MFLVTQAYTAYIMKGHLPFLGCVVFANSLQKQAHGQSKRCTQYLESVTNKCRNMTVGDFPIPNRRFQVPFKIRHWRKSIPNLIRRRGLQMYPQGTSNRWNPNCQRKWNLQWKKMHHTCERFMVVETLREEQTCETWSAIECNIFFHLDIYAEVHPVLFDWLDASATK